MRGAHPTCRGAGAEYSSKYPKNIRIILDYVIIFNDVMVKLGVYIVTRGTHTWHPSQQISVAHPTWNPNQHGFGIIQVKGQHNFHGHRGALHTI